MQHVQPFFTGRRGGWRVKDTLESAALKALLRKEDGIFETVYRGKTLRSKEKSFFMPLLGEAPYCDILADELSAEKVFYDIGAASGFYSVLGDVCGADAF
ncbi:MAG: hypothetical protein ABEI86_01495, partial [Halobacteriaceae archaeon]